MRGNSVLLNFIEYFLDVRISPLRSDVLHLMPILSQYMNLMNIRNVITTWGPPSRNGIHNSDTKSSANTDESCPEILTSL